MILNNVRIICAALLFSSGFAASNDDSFEIATLADGLDYPWAVTFISDNEMLVTELSGNLRRVSNGILNPTPIAGVPEVLFAGQGGLSEVTLDPSFADNGLLYLSFSAPAVDQPKLNQLNVIQARLEGNRLVDHKTIFKSDPPRKTAARAPAAARTSWSTPMRPRRSTSVR